MIALSVLTLVPVGVYMSWAYYQTERKAQHLENERIAIHRDATSVTEVGYILDSRTTRDFFKQETKKILWVKIPATNEVWACDWYAGFAAFQNNDSVLLVHTPGGPDGGDWTGYIVGMHYPNKDKVAQVWAIDVDGMEIDPPGRP